MAAATLAPAQQDRLPSEPGTATPSDPIRARASDRAVIDLYQNRHYRVESGQEPAATALPPRQSGRNEHLRVLRPRLRDSTFRYRSQFSNNLEVLPSYRAAILDHATERPPFRQSPAILTPAQREAAEWVQNHLDPDGLLPTLTKVLEILGPESFSQATLESLSLLRLLGLPVDLFACFETAPNIPVADRPLALVRHLAARSLKEPRPAVLRDATRQLPFRFVPAHPGFQVATESGEHAVGWLRLQAGGGYRGGIVPGGSIDLITRLIGTFPEAHFLVSVPIEIFQPFLGYAQTTWTLSLPDQATLVQEAFPVSAWAQDNGKPGTVERKEASPAAQTTSPPFASTTTLIPRYASIDDGQGAFAPGESFLVDGLAAAGHPVLHSSLLFQGGNLLAVRNPKNGRRTLLLGDAEVRRNQFLGLSESEVLQAFRIEFGVEECRVLPGVSYHLDFDLTVRAHRGELVALVNDPWEAARHIAILGVETLGRHGRLPSTDTQPLLEALRLQQDAAALERLAAIAPSLRRGETPQGEPSPPIPASWTQCFATHPVDSAAGNLQVFLLALDLLESQLPDTTAPKPPMNRERAAYLDALRRTDQRRRVQIQCLQQLGFRVCPIPSLPDLRRGINYLNGIQHLDGFVMPAFGGFFEPLDQAAIAAIQNVFGPEFRVIPLLCAETQRLYGGLHCVTAVHPARPQGSPAP